MRCQFTIQWIAGSDSTLRIIGATILLLMLRPTRLQTLLTAEECWLVRKSTGPSALLPFPDTFALEATDPRT